MFPPITCGVMGTPPAPEMRAAGVALALPPGAPLTGAALTPPPGEAVPPGPPGGAHPPAGRTRAAKGDMPSFTR